MAEKTKGMAAVGDASSIMAFRSLGMKTAEVSTEREITEAIHRFAREGCPVILVTEGAAEKAGETIRALRDSTYPVILVIPEKSGSRGYGARNIQSNIERAVGTSLFDD